MPEKSSALNELLKQQLQLAKKLDRQIEVENASGEMAAVPVTGKTLSTAYEQLRNAAEHAEEHLLLQRAIKRFCYRNIFITKRPFNGLGSELLVELTQAGYLKRDQFSKTTALKIDKLIEQYINTLSELRKLGVDREDATDWVLAIISTEAENILIPHHYQQATVYFAYHYFLEAINKNQFSGLKNMDNYEFCMFIAIHKALMNSDIDIVRHELLTLYQQSPKDIEGFKRLNAQIDKLFFSELTEKLKKIISRYGAPFRILKDMIDDQKDVAKLLGKEKLFMEDYARQITYEYAHLQKRINRGLIKSIAFIFITKVLIGLAIEVPYDLARKGKVAFVPLGINLILPPLYMASLKLGMRVPSSFNSQAIQQYMHNVLYSEPIPLIPAAKRRRSSAAIQIIYIFLFLIPLVITFLILQRIGFNFVQMFIFFIFFSTASFLGFRLSGLVRELELTSRQPGFFVSLRDLFYMPFIVLGQWLSSKYSKVNVVGRFLDIVIELPLKTVLRLLRQWIRFLYEKHEELY